MTDGARSKTRQTVRQGRPLRWHERNGRLLYGVAGIVGFLLFWEWGSANGVIDRFFFASPSLIVAAGAKEIQLERFWVDVRTSFSEFLIGYVLAIVLAIPLGLAAGWFRRLQYFLDPWMNFLNALPRFALMPVIVIAFGLGIQSKIAVVFLGAFFSIIIPTIQGVRTVDRRYIDVASSFRASRRRLFVTVVAPATVPFIVTGLRLGIARALIGVVTGELYAANDGLGVMIKKASDQLQVDRVLFGVSLFTFSGILLVEAVRRIEKYFQRWRPIKGAVA